MPITAYASTQDLVDGGWLDSEPPAAADRFLRSATFVVARAAGRNPYGDVPTDADVITLRDATCAQAAFWIANGLDPAKVGIDGPPLVKRTEILSAKVEYDTATHAKAREEAVSELAPEAEAILAAAGLLYAATPAYDASGCLPSWGFSADLIGAEPQFSGEWPIG